MRAALVWLTMPYALFSSHHRPIALEIMRIKYWRWRLWAVRVRVAFWRGAVDGR